METIHTYAMVSISLFDAFIICWDEKWRSILVRPETVINQHIDSDWIPFLQTPPFPEYTSGHSVISRSAARILTHLLGDNFEFLDTSEEKYGLPAGISNLSFMHQKKQQLVEFMVGYITCQL